MGHWLTKSQCNLLIADKHKAEHTGIFEINSILKSWFISVRSNIMATLLHFSAEYVGGRTDKQNISSLLFYSFCLGAVAVDARWGCACCRLTGRTKVDVKAQSQSKLYNRAESLLGSHTGETGEEGGAGSGVWGGYRIWKEKTCLCVCLPSSLCMLHMSCWVTRKIKPRQLRGRFLPHSYLSEALKIKNHKHAEYVTLLSVAWRQRATAAVKPFYLRHFTGNILKQLSFVFPWLQSFPLPDCSSSRRHNASS